MANPAPPSALAFAPDAHLPSLLLFKNGTRVATASQWPERRAELRALVETHILGSLPSEVPSLTGATILNSSSSLEEKALCSSYVRLRFLANQTNVTFDVELAWSCRQAARRQLPIFLTQFNHRGWGLAAAQRGYLMALYPGGDTRDASGDFRAAYPPASFRKILGRAYVASRTIDFLTSPRYAQLEPSGLPALNASRISISGHSRNGKQSLVAAAFDERIASVVGSSPGTPVSAPIRFSSPDFNGEPTLYDTPTRDWFLESLFAYYGREHEVPADGHMILAMIAPRAALIATADSDESGDVTFAVERGVHAALDAFGLVGAPGHLRVRYRPGRHHGWLDVQSYFDFFDQAAGLPVSDAQAGAAQFFPPHPLHLWDWKAWRQSVGPPPPPPPASSPLRERVEWLLGDGIAASWTSMLHAGTHYCEAGDVGTAYNFASQMMNRDSLTKCKGPKCTYGVRRHSLSFGAYVTADLFVPTNRSSDAPPLPVVIFLPGHSYHMGATGAYGHLSSDALGGLIESMASRGAAVLSWDMVGMGMRQHIDGAPLFYARHPRASRLGAMVGEVFSALDMIQCASASPEAHCADGEGHTGTYPPLTLPLLDPARVYLMGYSLGATVALHAAALTPPGRSVAGVAVFGGWSPLRSGAGGQATGGLRMLYETLGLIPRLGDFEGRLAQIPYDYDELITSLAPRQLLIYAAAGNRFAVASEVSTVIEQANQTWRAKGAGDKLETHTPATAVSEMRKAELAVALSWVERVVLGTPSRRSPMAYAAAAH